MIIDKMNELHEENEYLCEKIKENEWHWNTIDEDRDVWIYKCKRLEEENKQLKQRNKRLEEKIQRERTSFTKTHERWRKEAENKIKELAEENEQLKQLIRRVIQERVVDYPLLQELKEMVM